MTWYEKGAKQGREQNHQKPKASPHFPRPLLIQTISYTHDIKIETGELSDFSVCCAQNCRNTNFMELQKIKYCEPRNFTNLKYFLVKLGHLVSSFLSIFMMQTAFSAGSTQGQCKGQFMGKLIIVLQKLTS